MSEVGPGASESHDCVRPETLFVWLGIRGDFEVALEARSTESPPTLTQTCALPVENFWKSPTVPSLDTHVVCFRPNLSELSAVVQTLRPQRGLRGPAGGQGPVGVQGLETMTRLRRLK